MRKVVCAGLLGALPIALALAVISTSAAGTATRRPPPRRITLTAAPKAVEFSNRITLTGAVSPAKPNQSVDIRARSCGQPSFTSILGVGTEQNGAYSAGQIPTSNTVYQALWHSVTSAVVPVVVRPQITLTRLKPHRFRIRVMAARSLKDHKVLFQKRGTSRWSTVRSVRLKYKGQVDMTVISGRAFKSKIHRRRRVRILLGPKQAAPCYAGGHSGTIRS